jgi:predicted glutamine amidotransferase
MAPHQAGWGFAFRDLPSSNEQSSKGSNILHLRIKRGLRPIWESKWEDLTSITSDLFVIHARWALPWGVKFVNIHPITIDKSTYLVHNGIISSRSFPSINNPSYRQIFQATALDSRKYLLSLLDANKHSNSMTDAISNVVNYFRNDLSANSFVFDKQNLWIMNYHNSPLIQRFTYDLAIQKKNGIYCVASIPLTPDFKYFPNHSLLHYDFTRKRFDKTRI